MTKRTSSAKLLFYDVSGEGAKVQIMADLGCGPVIARSPSRLGSNIVFRHLERGSVSVTHW